MSQNRAPKREAHADPLTPQLVLLRLINRVMLDGKRGTQLLSFTVSSKSKKPLK